MTSEEVRLKCLEQAVKLVIEQPQQAGTITPAFTSPLTLAKQFAGFVFGFEWDADNDEYVEPEGDDSELKGVRAFDDEGQEL